MHRIILTWGLLLLAAASLFAFKAADKDIETKGEVVAVSTEAAR
jgi:hypothetical protein